MNDRTRPADDTASLPPDKRRAEQLEREIIELCGHLNAGEYRFLELVAEFDRDRHWEWWHGVASCAQWLSWQCGFDRVAASERVRIARALETLPKTRELFARGELSYSKVRAMTRVATPENEDALVTVAQFGTAQHIERLVRSYRRFERLEEAERTEARARARHVHYRYDEDGSLIIHAKLPPEVGDIVKKAIDAAVVVLYQDGMRRSKAAAAHNPGPIQEDATASETDCAEPSASPSAAKARAESNVSAGNTAMAGFSEADAFALTYQYDDDRIARETSAGLAAAAAHATRTQSNVSAGNKETPNDVRGDDAEPVGDIPGDDAEPPGDIRRDTCETSDGIRRNDDSSDAWSASPPESPRSTPGASAVEELQGESWCDSLGVRRADALALIAERYLSGDLARQGSTADRYQVVVHIDQALLAQPAAAGGPSEAETAGSGRLPLFDRCELEGGQALAIETARRLACDASLVGIVEDEDGEPLSVGRKTRSIPPSLARALRARDGGCRFPGCGRTRFTHGHHVVHWADGGETKLKNLITLCTYHHRLVHEGGFTVRATDDGAFIFTRPDGTRIEENGRSRAIALGIEGSAAAVCAKTGRPTLLAVNRRRGLDVEVDAAACRWLGERMDYNIAIAYMAACRDEARAKADAPSVPHG